MQYALDLAAKGLGQVAPNPMVGAVLVVDGEIIGEGFHAQFGAAHAEVNAFNSVLPENWAKVKSATLYVTLEPCNHFGKTPPCTSKIIESGIKKVVVGTADPNPLVNGEGIKRLSTAGINVTVGVLPEACQLLNKHFFCFHEKQRPYICLKWAQSADGFIAGSGGKQVHLTNPQSDLLVHKWRTGHSGILVGGRTIITDNPRLTARLWDGKQPTRIVLDTKGDLPVDGAVFNNEAPTLILTTSVNHTYTAIDISTINKDGLVASVLQALYEKKINSVLVEGGLNTLNLFIESGLWDEIRCFKTKHLLGEGISGPEMPEGGFEEAIGDDILLTIINKL